MPDVLQFREIKKPVPKDDEVLMFPGYLVSKIDNKKLTLIIHKLNKSIDVINKLYESGKVKPVIDRCFPLSETADAFHYFGEGHFKGKIVITVGHDDEA